MTSVCIIVPTHKSGAYFADSFDRLRRAAAPLGAKYDYSFLIAQNGSSAEDAAIVRQVAAAAPEPVSVLEIERAGKNGAINAAIAECRSRRIDAVQVVDDDQWYEERTLLANVEALVTLRKETSLSGLVGSRHLALARRPGSPSTDRRFGIAALVRSIASVAFEPNSERPKFCIGGSMCAWTIDVPLLPDDSLGIADDAYFCNYYYSRYRYLYRTTGLMPILFPQDSVVYFRVAESLAEYRKQQVRIRYGVLAAYRAFAEIEDELRSYFCWKYHCDDLIDRTDSPVLHALRWFLFRAIRRRDNVKAEMRLHMGIVGIEWSTANSTKRSAGAPPASARGDSGARLEHHNREGQVLEREARFIRDRKFESIEG